MGEERRSLGQQLPDTLGCHYSGTQVQGQRQQPAFLKEVLCFSLKLHSHNIQFIDFNILLHFYLCKVRDSVSTFSHYSETDLPHFLCFFCLIKGLSILLNLK